MGRIVFISPPGQLRGKARNQSRQPVQGFVWGKGWGWPGEKGQTLGRRGWLPASLRTCALVSFVGSHTEHFSAAPCPQGRHCSHG